MIKIENVEVYGWEAAIRGMRNPMNSWNRSDSKCECGNYLIGDNDLKLMEKLSDSGTDHGKFMRFINITADITAPLYFWKEFDQYKVGTVTNSCSTMHKIHEKKFSVDDFSHEHLDIRTIEVLNDIIGVLNDYRDLYVNYNADDFEIKGCPSKKLIWWQIIQILPSSYNQKRTVQLNYAVLKNIYHARKSHKLDEWRDLCGWIEKLPYGKELICGE